MEISRRVRSLPASPTLAINSLAKQMRAQGVDVLSFAAGEPDFGTPDAIKTAAHEALDAGLTRYVASAGDPDARAVIAEKLTRENNLPNVTADHVVITTGGKHALYLLFQSLFDKPLPDQEPVDVLLPTPAWVSYAPQLRLAGARVVELPTTPASDFKLTPEQLEEAITPNTGAFIFNSPSNPCGTTYTPKEVADLARAIARAADRHAPNLVVITDEIYEKLIYDGMTHRSLGSQPEVAHRTVTVNGLSKAYAMTGWRIGYLAGSGEFGKQIANAVAKLQSQTTTCIPAFLYPAICTALTECADDVEKMRVAFERRAHLAYERMQTIGGLVCAKPTGAFYLFPDVSAHFGKTSAGGKRLDSSADFAQALLEEHHVAVVPGEGFLGSGRQCIRFTFACAEEHISQGMDRIEAFVQGLR